MSQKSVNPNISNQISTMCRDMFGKTIYVAGNEKKWDPPNGRSRNIMENHHVQKVPAMSGNMFFFPGGYFRNLS